MLCGLIFFNIDYLVRAKPISLDSDLLLRHVDYPAPASNLFQSATTTLTSPTWRFGPSSGCNHKANSLAMKANVMAL